MFNSNLIPVKSNLGFSDRLHSPDGHWQLERVEDLTRFIAFDLPLDLYRLCMAAA